MWIRNGEKLFVPQNQKQKNIPSHRQYILVACQLGLSAAPLVLLAMSTPSIPCTPKVIVLRHQHEALLLGRGPLGIAGRALTIVDACLK